MAGGRRVAAVAILMQLLKVLLEVVANALLKVFTAPDTAKADPVPVLGGITPEPDDSARNAGLVDAYGGLLASGD
jgi:hypothetical protein